MTLPCTCPAFTTTTLPLASVDDSTDATSVQSDALVVSTREIQTITIRSAANMITAGVGGFRLQFGDETTATTLDGGDLGDDVGCILWSSGTSGDDDVNDAAALDAELETLDGIDDVVVTRHSVENPTSYVYSVTFTGSKVRGNVPLLEVVDFGTNGCSAFAVKHQ